MKKAFTLAEIMIVLTVIGILTAILMPIAFHSAPDENVMKFKKANSTIGTVVRELVSSDMYFQNGDLGKTAAGANPSATYLCKSMGDVMTYKTLNCTSYSKGSAYLTTNVKTSVDTECAKVTAAQVQIITPDGVSYFEVASSTPFSNSNLRTKNTDGFYNSYKPICIDVDGVGVGEAPFGYGLRLDGKMISGARADEWTAKSVQRGS